MKEFLLNQNTDFKIEIFSTFHLLLICFTFLLTLLIILNKEKLKKVSIKNQKIIRITFAIFLIINMIIRRGSFIYYGVYNWKYHLDINFCNFTSILFIIYGLTGNKKIYNICYYFAFIGPLLSIIFPSALLKPLTYSFYSFIIIHNFIFIFNIIFMYFEDLKYDNKEFYKIIIFILIYFSVIYIFNIIMDTNYNWPLTFVNQKITKQNFIRMLINYKLLVNSIFVAIVTFCLFIGNKFLRKSNK